MYLVPDKLTGGYCLPSLEKVGGNFQKLLFMFWTKLALKHTSRNFIHDFQETFLNSYYCSKNIHRVCITSHRLI